MKSRSQVFQLFERFPEKESDAFRKNTGALKIKALKALCFLFAFQLNTTTSFSFTKWVMNFPFCTVFIRLTLSAVGMKSEEGK